MIMALKVTSEPIAVSFGLNEPAANTFTTEEIGLQLDVLNNEVALVYAIDLDSEAPDAIAGTNTSVTCNVSSTAQTSVTGLENTNTLAQSRKEIRAAGFVDGGVAFQRAAETTPVGAVSYIGIIATNNFHIALTGSNNSGPKSMTGRVWLVRAKADAATYAALVNSEVLSA